jgi:hypothetical protein
MPLFKDTLVPLATYPDPTPEHVIDQAVAFSHLLGARLSALVSVIDRHELAKYYAHGAWLMDVPSLIDEIVARSEADGRRLIERFERTAAAQGILQDKLHESSAALSSPDHLVACARLRDLTFLPIPDFVGLDALQTEDVIFGTGHPVVLLPAYEGATVRKPSLDRIVVAWDFSQPAARALADAIPMLQRAGEVPSSLSGEKRSWTAGRHPKMSAGTCRCTTSCQFLTQSMSARARSAMQLQNIWVSTRRKCL